MSELAKNNYSEDFKRRAVDLYESTPGATLPGIANDLGISRGAEACRGARYPPTDGEVFRRADELVYRFQFVEDHKGAWSVKRLCKVIEIGRSSFYAWLAAAEGRAARAVAGVMREHGLAGIRLRKRVRTTISEQAGHKFPDHIGRDFRIGTPGRVRVGEPLQRSKATLRARAPCSECLRGQHLRYATRGGITTSNTVSKFKGQGSL